MRRQFFKAIVLTITSLAVSSCALPNLDQSLSTFEATNANRVSNDTHRKSIAIDTDSDTSNLVSVYTKHEEPLYAVLQVMSLPYSYNITLPVSTCLGITENTDLKTNGIQTLDARRIRTIVYPILNDNEVGLAFKPPSAGILGPQVNKLSEGVCLWSSSQKYANIIRLIRPLKFPVSQKSYMHLFTERECRGKYVLSDSLGWEATLFAEVVEEWSILFTCSDYEYGAENREPVIERMQELELWDAEEETAAMKSLLKKFELPAAHQISAIPQNATLALTQTYHPQIFQIPLSTCLSSTSETHSFASSVRIVNPPTCPPELPRLSTLIYDKPGCLHLRHVRPTENSYPLYRLLFEYMSGANLRVDGWSLEFLCHPVHFNERVTSIDWNMETEMELILEGKGRDAAVNVVRTGAGERGEEGLTQDVQLESQMKIEAAAQKPLRDV
ncbi:hypothetical protein EAE96_000695 [Botrytis aclada]|nr:hypothetical protein EAE96_000695 [Botrytis aclada]